MSHYIRTIHTDFTSRSPVPSSSWSSSRYAGTSASAHANLLHNLGGIIDKYPPGLGHNEWRALSSPSTGASPSPYTRRRSGVSVRAPHSAPARRTPPPPRVQPASTTYIKFDPFSDDFSLDLDPLPSRRRLSSLQSTASTAAATDPVLYRTPRTIHIPPAAAEVAPGPPPLQQQPQTQLDRNARSRLIAGILLNRVHAVGKPMRRRSGDVPREYIKSGLSRVVCVEA
ncbi:hypothetical protein D9615_002099 [Tricholomella constricta]|uniref:Uncharacterized protein n=1 Tax=Tricholomella constricta TaxID=117010 RepID=A0A8H5HPF6_9AGAR|nr:hypothetical protein D9615_002099 [Tricholomella constricta]